MDGRLFRRRKLVWGVRNEVVVGAMGEDDGGGDGHCSRGFMWRSWELRGRVVTVDGGFDGGSG